MVARGGFYLVAVRAVLLFQLGRGIGLQLHGLFRLAAQYYRRLGAEGAGGANGCASGAAARRSWASERSGM